MPWLWSRVYPYAPLAGVLYDKIAECHGGSASAASRKAPRRTPRATCNLPWERAHSLWVRGNSLVAKNPPDLVARTTAVIGTLLGLFGLWLSYSNYRWQQNTYQESHEESPRIHGSVSQTGKQLNPDKLGRLYIQITNLGKRTMQIKTVTLSGWNRVWILYVPPEKTTFDVEPGCNYGTKHRGITRSTLLT